MKWTLLQTQFNQWFLNNLLFSPPSNSVYDVYPAIIQLFSIPREPAARFYKLTANQMGPYCLCMKSPISLLTQRRDSIVPKLTQWSHAADWTCKPAKSWAPPTPSHYSAISTLLNNSDLAPYNLCEEISGCGRDWQGTDGNPKRGLEKII